MEKIDATLMGMDEMGKMLTSKSETITVKEQRKFLELAHGIAPILTGEELLTISGVFGQALARLLEENGISNEF